MAPIGTGLQNAQNQVGSGLEQLNRGGFEDKNGSNWHRDQITQNQVGLGLEQLKPGGGCGQ